MRINNNMMSGMDTLEQTSRKKNVEKVSANDKQNSSVVESDEVSISEKGKDVSEMTRTLKEMPDVRADKVADLKERIANGTYNISGKDIASKIINTALEDVF
ncbi:flagellar biosynthesis anti-sigma factor FlgM [Mucispirillum schaedleri]|uniref:flagellar biosynthesis anti-sigma factor FlgM n=1 Tax=Mucispirillum schaedleri TaxID=248039 RepID=UPI001F55C030|nr:flagellar biosynthesis anti-sigma factor FlgM [Mucispirillum schaedleri]